MNIKVSILNDIFDMYITEHFREQSVLRGFSFKDDDLPDILEKSYLIKNRPRNKLIMLRNNCEESIYLWNRNKGCIFVVGENSKTHYFNILKTIYSSKKSGWLKEWSDDNPKNTRVLLKNVELNKLKID